MKDFCETAEESIWDCAREGAELPEDVARHVETCESCAQVLKRIPAAMRLLQAAGHVSETADATPITRRIRAGNRPISRWAYGLAAAAVLAIAILSAKVMLTPRAPCPPAPSRVAKAEKAARPISPPNTVRLPAVERKAADTARVAGTIRPIRRHNVLSEHRAPALHNRPRWVAKAVPVPLKPASVKLKQSDESRRVLAAVSVAWTPAYDPEDVSYGYSETDPDTGKVFRASMSRKGNSIVIRLESGSEEDQPQIKGETNNETIPSA